MFTLLFNDVINEKEPHVFLTKALAYTERSSRKEKNKHSGL